MSILVLVDGWEPAPWVRALKAAMPDERIEAYPDIKDPEAVEYALVWAAQGETLDAFPNLKALFSLGAGVDHLFGGNTLPPVPLARVVDPDLTAWMTEWVVAQVLLHHRQQLQYSQQQRHRNWQVLAQPLAREVQVGLMGLGELGRDAAGLLHKLGFGLRGWSRTPKELDNVTCFYGADGLDEFLSGTDILVCLLPLTPETNGLIGTSVFEKLHRSGPLGGPVFINAGRGRIHVETDVVAALQSGVLKAASLDVFEVEPLPQNSPLWDLDNIVITPHVAAVSDPKTLSKLIARQMRAHREGRSLEYLVDMTRGY